MKPFFAILCAAALLVPVPVFSSAVAAATQEREGAPPPPPPSPPAPPAGPATPVPPQPPPPPPAPPAPRSERSTSNIQLDLIITDTHGGKPVRKAVTMLVRSGQRGLIRSTGNQPVRAGGVWNSDEARASTPTPVVAYQMKDIQLNIDASATEMNNQLINVIATFEFTPAVDGEEPASRSAASPAELRQQINVVLRNGKPLLVSRSADPATDRTVTVELTATIREQ